MYPENHGLMVRGGNGRPWVYMLGFGIPAFLILFALFQNSVSARALFDDLPSTTGVHPLTGGINYANGMIWFGSGIVCLFAARIATARSVRRFLICAGILTAVLAIDDVFMVHDYMLPAMGITERYPKALYLLATSAYLTLFRRFIRQAEWPVLVLSGGFFVASLVVDNPAIGKLFLLILPEDIAFYVLEDGLKTVGISLWSFFHIHTASRLIRPSFSPVEESVAAQRSGF